MTASRMMVMMNSTLLYLQVVKITINLSPQRRVDLAGRLDQLPGAAQYKNSHWQGF